jgi:hypothetical protein
MKELIGQRVTIFCAVYIYTGKLVEVTDTYAKLEDAAIVYETGAFDNKNWQDAQKLPHDWCVSLGMVESFGVLK